MRAVPLSIDGEHNHYRGDELVATAYARNYNRWIMHFLEPHLGRVIVEVGAGTGSYTRELLTTNPERLLAVEPSIHLYPQLERALADFDNVETSHGTLRMVADKIGATADTVVYVNVLEHIADDAAEVREAARVLKPGGKLALFVPALPWLSSRFDRDVGHQRRYQRRELVDLVNANGLRVIEARYFDLLGIAIWLIVMRFMGMRMGAGRVRLYDSVIVPVARTVDRLLGPPLGKSLIVIAERQR